MLPGRVSRVIHVLSYSLFYRVFEYSTSQHARGLQAPSINALLNNSKCVTSPPNIQRQRIITLAIVISAGKYNCLYPLCMSLVMSMSMSSSLIMSLSVRRYGPVPLRSTADYLSLMRIGCRHSFQVFWSD